MKPKRLVSLLLCALLLCALLPASATADVRDAGIDNWTLTLIPNYENGGSAMIFTTEIDGNPITLPAMSQEGYTFRGWAETSDGDPVYAAGYRLTLTSDLTLYAIWEIHYDTVSYVTPAGETLSAYCQTVSSAQFEWLSGWYAVDHDVTIDRMVIVPGDAHLILCDGAKLTITGGLWVKTQVGSLTVWGQANGTGALETTGSKQVAGIGSNSENVPGDITINGGTVTAAGGEFAAGIGGGFGYAGGNITINGGTVTATGGKYAAGVGGGDSGAGGNITINGGTVTATGGESGAGVGGGNHGAGGNITINGGTITARGGICAPGVGDGDGVSSTSAVIGLSWTNADDRYDLGEIRGASLTFDKAFCASTEDGFETVTEEDANDKILVPAAAVTKYESDAGTVTAVRGETETGIFAVGETVTLLVSPGEGYTLQSLTATGANGETVTVTDNTFLMPAYDVTLSATFAEPVTLTDGYYLIGPNWTTGAIDASEKFEVNPGNENEYMLSTTLAAGDEIKVIHLTSNVIDAWYPDGEDTQYHVDAAHAGSVNIYFQTTYNNAWSEFGGYFYIGEGAEPEFKTHSLTLDGKIGVNFFMELPAIAGVDYTESYMTFEISGAGEVSSDPVPLDEDNMNGDETYYGFTCYVAPIQMADTITATFHYGDGLTVSQEYSIEQYIGTFGDMESQFDETTVSLVHALADYGHYVQLFLEGVKDWSLGDGDDQYAPMDIFYETDGYNAEAIAEDVAEFAFVRNNESTDIQKITYSVRLDSDTTILVYFKPVKNYSGEFTVTLDGDPYTATPEGGRYVVEIPNIGAHLLGTTYTIVATTDSGDATVEVSVLSYVRGILNSSAYADDTAAKNGVCAIYAYYVAAKAYKDAQPEN